MSYRKTLKDLASLKRPWVTENLWNNWKTYQMFVGRKKIIQNKPTAWLRNIFLLLQSSGLLCSRHIMFRIILLIIFPSCTSFSDFVFSEDQSTCILSNYLRISILYIIIFQQTAEVLGNLTDFFFFSFLLLYLMPKLNKLIISQGLYQKLSCSAGIYFQGRKGNLFFLKVRVIS